MLNLNNRDLLATTLQAEAGNQGPVGMMSVGSVIMNRLKNPAYGSDLHQVILQPGQFSAWNNYTGYADGVGGLNMNEIVPSQQAYMVADQILDGNYNDPTGGALHYYNPNEANPAWGQRSGGQWKKIGDHLFGFPGTKDPNRRTAMNVNSQPVNSMPQQTAANPPRRGLFDFIGKAVGNSFSGLRGALDGSDPDKSDRLAIALMSLSGNPNQLRPLMQMAASDIQERKEQRLLNKGKNQTVEYLTKLANEGDAAAASALRLVEPAGAANALTTYINATSSNAANKTGANTKTYPNGLTISVFQDGSKRVSGPDGTILEGPAATEAIKAAQADELRQAELTEFKTKSASAKAGMVQSTVNNILNVDSSLRNMARAKNALRTAIANGQNITGLVTQFFPDVSVEAAELRNARNALGLDVVGSVTFGALSKGELDLALSQGLPLGLNEPQLLEFIERREAAMRKYRQSLMEAARIYADPEQNFDDYLKSLEEVEISNPYNETPDDELEQLFIQVMSGTSNISVKNRQFIVDEVDRRAEL